jgi:hypothetical protein
MSPALVGAPLAASLEAGRGEYNRRFSEAKRRFPDLDAGAFADFLATFVDPLVQAVEPDRAALVTGAAFEAGLELVGRHLVGPHARQRWVEETWRHLVPALAAPIGLAPLRLLGALSNAAHRLATQPGARPGLWISTMVELAAACRDPDLVLRAGRVAAWRSGLAVLRPQALAELHAFDPEFAALTLGLARPAAVPELLVRLSADPWFDPAAPPDTGLRLAGWVGSFRGWGGDFGDPPLVSHRGDHLFALADGRRWWIAADTFGASLEAVAAADVKQTPRLEVGELQATGATLLRGAERLEVPQLGRITSVASNRHTAAVTGFASFRIALVALT